MLPIAILAFASLAVASYPDTPELFPRQELDLGDPCYQKGASVYDSQPTLPAVYQSFTSSVYATMTNNCTGFRITGAPLTAYESWRNDQRQWATSHSSEIADFTTSCSSFLSSYQVALESSLESRRSSCRDKTGSSTATRSAGTTPRSSSAITTSSSATAALSESAASTGSATSGSAAPTTTDTGSAASSQLSLPRGYNTVLLLPVILGMVYI